MQRCPKCGYRDTIDWPWILVIVAFVASKLATDHGTYRWFGVVASFLFAGAILWYALRSYGHYRDGQLQNMKD